MHNPSFAALAALALIGAGASVAGARGSPHEHPVHAESIPPCGWSNGGLPDPAQTQRCLAERYKPPKPKPANDARAPTTGG
jgi:hypothetical protein